jgi:hypothetical protein
MPSNGMPALTGAWHRRARAIYCASEGAWEQQDESGSAAGERLISGEAWADFCDRLKALGERILKEDFPSRLWCSSPRFGDTCPKTRRASTLRRAATR